MGRGLVDDLIEDALEKMREKLHKDLPIIASRIKETMDNKKFPKNYVMEYSLKWTLVRQECEMYCLIGENVEKNEFNKLCKRNKFTRPMRNYIVEMMKHVGLGDNLEF